MRKFVERFIADRGITLNEFAREMGYSSRTTLYRVMDGNVRPETIRQFKERAEKAFVLTAEERRALLAAAERKQKGEEVLGAEQAFMRLLSGEEPRTDMPRFVLPGGKEADDPAGYLRSLGILGVTAFNAAHPAAVSVLKLLLEIPGVKVKHYIGMGSDERDTIELFALLRGVFFHARYECYLWKREYAQPRGLCGADMFFLSRADGGYAALVFGSDGNVAVWPYWASAPEPPEDAVPTRTLMPENATPEAYANYVRYCAGLDEVKHIYMVKPDLFWNCVGSKILKAALELEPLLPLADELAVIFDRRYEETFNGKHHIHLIAQQSAMIRFAQTGRLSDHFFGMRPFTPNERRWVLENFLAYLERSPFLHFYFWKDGSDIPDIEADLYEGKGLLLQNAFTSYELSSEHREALITYEPLMRDWRDFYLNTLEARKCRSREESIRLFREVLEYIPEE